jgi:hypothetical protein
MTAPGPGPERGYAGYQLWAAGSGPQDLQLIGPGIVTLPGAEAELAARERDSGPEAEAEAEAG